MKNAAVHYLLAAMAHNAAHIARESFSGYSDLVHFGQHAVAAERLSDLCQGEGDCTKEMVRKIRRFLKRNFFGADEWYRIALEALLAGKKVEFDEFELEYKTEFDQEFKKLYKLEPPNLGEL